MRTGCPGRWKAFHPPSSTPHHLADPSSAICPLAWHGFPWTYAGHGQPLPILRAGWEEVLFPPPHLKKSVQLCRQCPHTPPASQGQQNRNLPALHPESQDSFLTCTDHSRLWFQIWDISCIYPRDSIRNPWWHSQKDVSFSKTTVEMLVTAELLPVSMLCIMTQTGRIICWAAAPSN